MARGALLFTVAVCVCASAPLPARSMTPALAAPDDVVALKPGAPIDRALEGTDRHAYDIELQAGQYASLMVDQHGIDVVIRVLDASGVPAAVFDDEVRKEGREHLALVADASRTYRVTVSARYPKQESGRYAIWIDEVRGATDRDRSLYEARQLSMQSADLRTAGKLDDALARATRAATLADEALGAHSAYVGVLVGAVAALQRAKGQQREAEQSYVRALDITQAALGREHPQAAALMETLGVLYNAMDDYGKAEPLMVEGTAITERTLGDHPRLATCLMDLALLHTNRSDYTRAVAELQRAQQIADRTMTADDFAAIAILNNLGDLYITLKEYDRAQPYLERALHGLERTLGPDNYRTTTPMSNLAIIAREHGDYARAIDYLQRAYDIRVKTYGTEHTQTANLLTILGNVYHAQGDYLAALDAYHRAHDVLERTEGPYHSFTMVALSNIARAYAAGGRIDDGLQAQAHYDALLEKSTIFNLAIGSERQKLAYLEDTFRKMGRTISLHLRQAPASAEAADLGALAILRRKGRVLDALTDSRAALRARLDPGDRTLLDDLSNVTAQISKLALGGPGRVPAAEYTKTLASLEEEQESLEARISRRSAEFRAAAQPVTLAAIRSALPRESALIEFAVYQPFNPKAASDKEQYSESHYAAYVIRSGAPTRGVDLGPAAAVDQAVARVRQALRDPARQDVVRLARTLDDLVLRPIRGLAGDATQLLIAPDGALNLVPFEALVDERGRFQVERYAISYLGSGRDLLRMQVARPSAGAPLVVAAPAFGEPATSAAGAQARAVSTGGSSSAVYFAPLAGTAQEAAAIGRLLPGATLVTGPRATKAVLTRAAAPSVLHIASHAFFVLDEGAKPEIQLAGTRSMTANVRSPNPLLRSGIALAGANLSSRGSDAGILTALEASTLNLWGTKLVTLSACDTGIGDVKNGEGVYGLRRAFFVAGAESVVMSLWSVSDYVTRSVMTGYYAGLVRGEGRGAALRRVQLAMLAGKDRRHPFYWASFIQAGDWTPIQHR